MFVDTRSWFKIFWHGLRNRRWFNFKDPGLINFDAFRVARFDALFSLAFRNVFS